MIPEIKSQAKATTKEKMEEKEQAKAKSKEGSWLEVQVEVTVKCKIMGILKSESEVREKDKVTQPEQKQNSKMGKKLVSYKSS